MYNSPEYQAMINVAKTYAEGFKDFPKDKVEKKVKEKMSKGGEKAAKQVKSMETAKAAHTDPDIKPFAQDMVKSVEKENRLTGQKKALGRAYDNSGEKQSKEVTELQKKSAEIALKAKPVRPKSRMPKHKSSGTMKK